MRQCHNNRFNQMCMEELEENLLAENTALLVEALIKALPSMKVAMLRRTIDGKSCSKCLRLRHCIPVARFDQYAIDHRGRGQTQIGQI